ncbi:MAG: GAF domain-containing protein [Actinomycetes bacterium]|jgi:GAF domain-containing protein
MPIDRKSVTQELRLLLQGRDSPAGEGLAPALQRVAEAATTILRAQGASVLLADEHETLRCAAASNQPGLGLATAQEHLHAGPALDSFASELPVASRDVTTDGRWPDLRHLIDRAAVRAVLSAPLTFPGGHPIGALNLHSSEARDWNVAEIAATAAYAGVVASLISMALEARLRGVLLDKLLDALRTTTRPDVEDG